LFATIWETMRELTLDPHHLGAEVGLLAILHTWGQTLCAPATFGCFMSQMGGWTSPEVLLDGNGLPTERACAARRRGPLARVGGPWESR
jgi:hypothetical protein